jgi:hypothetical protein
MKSTLPDRLSILADGAAAAVLAFALDEAIRRWHASGKARMDTLLRNPYVVCYGIAVIAIVPLIPTSYSMTQVTPVPAGYSRTYTALHLPSNATVLVVPVPNGGVTQPLRWYGDRGVTQQMIGGDFIDASAPGRASRAGRAGITELSTYMNALQTSTRTQYLPPEPTRAQIVAQMAAWKPAAMMANTQLASELGQFLVKEFGLPQVQIGSWLGWRLNSSGM